MEQFDSAFVQRVLDSAPEGIAICDARAPDFPVLYVNKAFEIMTGTADNYVMELRGMYRHLIAAPTAPH